MERWAPVPIERFAPHYDVSDHGKVRRRTKARGTYPGKLLRRKNQVGYPKVVLHVHYETREIGVHTLVALAFVGPQPSAEHEVAHWDGDEANCHYKNLRWATRSENSEDKRRHGTLSKIMNQELAERIRASTGSRRSIARRFGIKVAHVGSIKRGDTWNPQRAESST